MVRFDVRQPRFTAMPNLMNLLETAGFGGTAIWASAVAVVLVWLAWAAWRSPDLTKAFACAAIAAPWAGPSSCKPMMSARESRNTSTRRGGLASPAPTL